jgi:hypothetical protein
MHPIFARNCLVVVAIIVLGSAPALANESKFEFEMEHRYVNGVNNGILHKMSRGILTVSGEVVTVNCAVVDEETGKTAVPELVRFNVMQEGSVVDGPPICSFAVTPAGKIGKKVTFDVTCNDIGDAKVYIVVYQVTDDDRCIIEATGRLTTL